MNPSFKNKYLTLAAAILFLFSVSLPMVVSASSNTTTFSCPAFKAGDPIVYCGNGDPTDPGFVPCDFNAAFCTVNRVVKFILVQVIPPLAVIYFVIAGFLILTAAGNPSKVQQGKQMITYGVIGIILVYGAWIIVYEFVGIIGGANQKEWLLQFFRK
ncbi:MAG: pilin [Candidatus Pacebacteria bacterium]|nr:pilin [Candidatus Paceibacterota bacterium]